MMRCDAGKGSMGICGLSSTAYVCHAVQSTCVCVSFAGGFRMCHCFVVGISTSFINRCMRDYNFSSTDFLVYGSIGVHYRELAKFYHQQPDFAAKAEARAVKAFEALLAGLTDDSGSEDY